MLVTGFGDELLVTRSLHFFILHFSRCSWSCCLRRLRKKVSYLRVTWLWGASSTTTPPLGPIRTISSWCWAFNQSESRRIITRFIWFGVNGSEFEDFGQSHFRSSNWKNTTWPRLIILFKCLINFFKYYSTAKVETKNATRKS